MTHAAGLLGIWGAPLGRDRLDSTVARAPWRGQARAIASTPCGGIAALGSASLAHHGAIAVALHGRLDNLAELAERWSLPAGDAAAIIAAGYEAEGDAFAERVLGDFALLLLDERRGTLLAARDWAGARPLFWGQHGDCVAFGSEAKQVQALLDRPLRPDEQALAAYEAMGEPELDATFVAGVKAVLPSGQVLVGDGPPRAWRRPVRFRPVNLDLPAAVDAVRAALETAVSRRSHDAGRLGAQLSGGMDSTSVLATAAALAVRSSGPAPRMAFTAHYPELPECDETALARQVAERWRVPWSPVTVHPRELLPDDGRALGLHDGPVFPGFAVQSRLMSAAAEQVDVLLSGAGGDNWLRQESQEVRLALLRGAWRSAGEWAWWYGRYGGRWRSIVRQGLDAAQQAIHGVSAEAEFADRASHFGVRWSLELIEREGMRHGLRVELPFYDFELANLLAGLPVDVRSTRGVTKRVMRAAMDGQLPEAVRGRKDWTDSGLLLRAAIGETAAGERASQVLARHFAERWRREAGSPGDARAAGE